MTRRTIALSASLLLALTVIAVLQGAGDGLLASVGDGLTVISGVDLPQGDPREKVEATLRFLVTFVALAAVITIIAAGVFFMVGAGSDTAVQRGRKIILYTIVGLLLIFFTAVIVGFFTIELPAA